MTQQEAPTEVRVREVRQRSGEFVETAVELAGGVARLGLGLAMIPLNLLPKETRVHTRNAIKELSYALAQLPGEFIDIASEKVEQWAKIDDKAVAKAAPYDEVQKTK